MALTGQFHAAATLPLGKQSLVSINKWLGGPHRWPGHFVVGANLLPLTEIDNLSWFPYIGIFFQFDQQAPAQCSARWSASIVSYATCHGGLMMGARQMIMVILTYRKSNKNSLEHWVNKYWSSSKRNTLYFNTHIILVCSKCCKWLMMAMIFCT